MDARPGPAGPDDRTSPTAIALGVVGRLLSAPDERSLLDSLVEGAQACFDARGAVVLLPAHEPGRLQIATGPKQGTTLTELHPLLAQLLDQRTPHLRAGRATSKELYRQLTGAKGTGVAMLLLLTEADGRDAVLTLTGLAPPPVDTVDVSVATAFADAGAAGLARMRAAAEHERQAGMQRALTRAAKQLNESLDLGTVTARIVHEAVTILGADTCAVYRKTASGGAVIDHAIGTPPGALGFELAPGQGLAGKVMQDDQPRLAEDYQAIANLPAGTPMALIRSALAAPMRWDGETRGSLTVGFHTPRDLTAADLGVLETFAELAASAYANATAHAGIVQAARTDGLTGCLNHTAMQQALQLEIERSRRTGDPLSLVLVDLDHFKAVNERHGHLAGDEALRSAGAALRHTTRPYDLAARYGGDEFALVTVGAAEATAAEVAERALQRMDASLSGLTAPGERAATAGVAEWHPRQDATDLIAAADRALLWAKHRDLRGTVVRAIDVPPHFLAASSASSGRPQPSAAPVGTGLDERLRKRTQQLALANALGTRLAAMTDRALILETAAEELHRAFGYFCTALVEREGDRVRSAALRGDPFLRLLAADWSQPADHGLIGRAIRTGRPVLSNDVRGEPDYSPTDQTLDVHSELVVPVEVDGVLWGVINLEELEPGAFDVDDLTLVETIAAQVGSALRSAAYYERLERAYMGTAEALAGALEAKDAYTADHARQIADQASSVAAAMGLDEDAVRDVRLAAVLHDIGKIAIPESILNKPGPLTDEELEVVKRHTVVGEQILAPVEFLAGVCPLVRHEHERWDGGGYPDGLAGEDIPLGSRIILACDALHAMTSDRPYRKAMSLADAHAELRRYAGTQFDPQVVDTLLGAPAAPTLRLSAAEPPARLAG